MVIKQKTKRVRATFVMNLDTLREFKMNCLRKDMRYSTVMEDIIRAWVRNK